MSNCLVSRCFDGRMNSPDAAPTSTGIESHSAVFGKRQAQDNLQGSAASNHKTLQSQTRRARRKRLSLKGIFGFSRATI
jgi:predicted metal-dependent HD superfamily phosphohydrolase